METRMKKGGKRLTHINLGKNQIFSPGENSKEPEASIHRREIDDVPGNDRCSKLIAGREQASEVAIQQEGG